MPIMRRWLSVGDTWPGNVPISILCEAMCEYMCEYTIEKYIDGEAFRIRNAELHEFVD